MEEEAEVMVITMAEDTEAVTMAEAADTAAEAAEVMEAADTKQVQRCKC